jgi:AraC-like DNA-binding protein
VYRRQYMVRELQISEVIFSIVIFGFLLTAFITIIVQLFFPSLWSKRNTSTFRKLRKRIPEDLDLRLINEEKMDEIDIKIKDFFARHQPFLSHSYSLKQLSEETGIPKHYLSYFLNARYKMNFRVFLNEHRMNHFISKIRNEEWRFKTLEAIANESGFNNRTTFIAACKRATGMTPSEYLKEISRGGNRPSIGPSENEDRDPDTHFVRYIHDSK